MMKKQKKALFHIELDGKRIHTDINGNNIDLVKCLCIAMAHNDAIARLICVAAKAWKEFNEMNTADETVGSNQANQE